MFSIYVFFFAESAKNWIISRIYPVISVSPIFLISPVQQDCKTTRWSRGAFWIEICGKSGFFQDSNSSPLAYYPITRPLDHGAVPTGAFWSIINRKKFKNILLSLNGLLKDTSYEKYSIILICIGNGLDLNRNINFQTKILF